MYGRSRSRISQVARAGSARVASPKLQISFGAAAPAGPPRVDSGPVCGSRSPCMRSTGQNVRELEPARQQLAEARVVGRAAVEPADVGRPPGDPGQPHVEPGSHLLAERHQRRVGVARPDQRAVALRPPRPRASGSRSRSAQPRSAPRRTPWRSRRVDVADLEVGTQVVADVVEVVDRELRLRLVEPEDADARRPSSPPLMASQR